ncbi:MAG: bacillithiol biosynthesis cysteine-adding enzyme BshC [Candidatus Sumerlaeaceae bacterium]|nr:bacillithiol biosynthesis cysteine-adding enzyme BshC [Candidatus Sumerlaeaceae bacterium]
MPEAVIVRSASDLLAGFAFASDALAGTGAARELLPGWFGDVEGAVERRERRPSPPWNSDEVAELAAFNRQFGNESGAQAAAHLADPQTVAVVTGQQPNLLASPLYVLHKAASAVALARHWEQRLARPVIPIFWVASDDHDFAELRECHLLGAGADIVSLGYQVSRGEGVPADSPAFEWNLSDSSPRLIRRLEAALPEGPARGETVALVATALASGATFESVFCHILSGFFADAGLVMLVPRLKAVRRRGAGVLRRDMLSPGLLADALEKRGASMAAAGYPVPLQRSPEQINCFYLEGRVRRRMMRRGEDGTVAAERPSALTDAIVRHQTEWLEQLTHHPEAFSPNVITRPLVQDHALPTIAYVAGPGEMAYLAQMADVYECCDIPQPLVLPRSTGILVDAATARELEGAGLSVEDLLLPPDDLAAKAAAADPIMAPLLAEVVHLEEAIAAATGRMLATGVANRPAVRVAIAKTAAAQHRSLSRLRRRLWRQGREMGVGAWASLARGLACVRPLGGIQDRVLSPLSFCGDVPMQRLGHTALTMAGDWLRALHQPATGGMVMPVRIIAAD